MKGLQLIRAFMEKFKEENGFSLVELMISVGLLGIISVSVLQLSYNAHKVSKMTSKNVEIQKTLTEMKLILNNDKSCELTLKDKDPQGKGGPVKSILSFDGNKSIEKFKVNGIYGEGNAKIKIKSMNIGGYKDGQSILEIKFLMGVDEKTIKGIGPKVRVRKLSVNTNMGADEKGNLKIKNCVTEKDNFLFGSCQMIGGNFNDEKNCRSINVKKSLDNNQPAIKILGKTIVDGNFDVSGDSEVGNNQVIENDLQIFGKAVMGDGNSKSEFSLGTEFLNTTLFGGVKKLNLGFASKGTLSIERENDFLKFSSSKISKVELQGFDYLLEDDPAFAKVVGSSNPKDGEVATRNWIFHYMNEIIRAKNVDAFNDVIKEALKSINGVDQSKEQLIIKRFAQKICKKNLGSLYEWDESKCILAEEMKNCNQSSPPAGDNLAGTKTQNFISTDSNSMSCGTVKATCENDSEQENIKCYGMSSWNKALVWIIEVWLPDDMKASNKRYCSGYNFMPGSMEEKSINGSDCQHCLEKKNDSCKTWALKIE